MQRSSPRFRSEEYFVYEKLNSKKRFTQIYRDLYGDAMLEDGNQQKQLLPSFATKG